MTSQLSQADVARLLKEPSPLVRAEIASKLAHEIDSPRLSDEELNLAHEVVRLMARDVETSVRQSLAKSLRHAVRLPHDVAVKLANDVEAVAIPILENSAVLTEEDLIAVVRGGSPDKQAAIAGRPNVSETLCDVLIDNAGEKVVTKLMQNVTAQISPKSMDKAIDKFQTSEAVKEAMVKRPTLPITVAERLVTLVSERLKEQLMLKHELPPALAADLVLQSRERSVLAMAKDSSEGDVEKLVQQMYQNKRLTSSIVIRSLCMGDVLFFEAAMAIMANVPLVNARILIHDAGRLGLKTLYENAGMPPRMLSVIRMALDVVRETEMDASPHALEKYRARVIERILTQTADMAPEDTDYLLAKLGDVMGIAVA